MFAITDHSHRNKPHWLTTCELMEYYAIPISSVQSHWGLLWDSWDWGLYTATQKYLIVLRIVKTFVLPTFLFGLFCMDRALKRKVVPYSVRLKTPLKVAWKDKLHSLIGMVRNKCTFHLNANPTNLHFLNPYVNQNISRTTPGSMPHWSQWDLLHRGLLRLFILPRLLNTRQHLFSGGQIQF